MDHLEQLKVFRKVVERGSLSRAARDLGITQPTVSKAVARLEARVRTQLLLRSTRRLSVTEAGRRYYEHCRVILESLDEAERELGDDATPRGTLRLHGPVVLGELFLGPIAVEFQRRHPQVRCELTFLDSFVDLIAEGADVAIRLGEVSDASIVRRRLGSMRRMFVAAPRYLRAAGVPKAPADLAGHPAVRFSGLPTGDTVTAGEARVAMQRGFLANNAVVLRDALVGGLGVGLVTEWLVAEQLERGTLVEVLPLSPPPPIEVSAVFPSPRFIPLRARMYVDFLVTRLRGRRGMQF
jgi:DNA-binding transcriptional LysR family regulator